MGRFDTVWTGRWVDLTNVEFLHMYAYRPDAGSADSPNLTRPIS